MRFKHRSGPFACCPGAEPSRRVEGRWLHPSAKGASADQPQAGPDVPELRRSAADEVGLRNGYLEIRAGMPTEFHPPNTRYFPVGTSQNRRHSQRNSESFVRTRTKRRGRFQMSRRSTTSGSIGALKVLDCRHLTSTQPLPAGHVPSQLVVERTNLQPLPQDFE